MKEYHTPHLIVYGVVSSLTAAGTGQELEVTAQELEVLNSTNFDPVPYRS